MLSDTEKGDASKGQMLSHEEILGNMFIFLLAGHETTANAVHFSLLHLACNVATQRRLQADLDKIFDDRPVSEWNYDKDLPKLFGGMAGAVMNETLRIVPSVVNIPKSTKTAQQLTMDGRKVTVPANTNISLVTVSTHRNPKYWPTARPEDADPNDPDANDLHQFKPERWLLSANAPASTTSNNPDDGLDAPLTASTLFSPVRGAFIPFSEGPRSCLGRRFAQVEILAALALIFCDYSVELDVSEWTSLEEVEKVPKGSQARKDIWMKARKRADYLMTQGMGTLITLKMKEGNVPLRIVKRGKERFEGS